MPTLRLTCVIYRLATTLGRPLGWLHDNNKNGGSSLMRREARGCEEEEKEKRDEKGKFRERQPVGSSFNSIAPHSSIGSHFGYSN